MKNHITLLILIFLFARLTAQVSIPVGTPAQISSFMNGKTYVVLENSKMSDYNDIIEASVKQDWTVNPVEFISMRDFEAHRNEKNASFLMIMQVSFDADKTQTLFDFFVLVAGGNYKTVNDMPLLCMVPLCYNETPEEEWLHKIPVAVRFTQMHLKTVKTNPGLTSKSCIDYYMAQKGTPENKTLYLLKDDLDPALRSEAAFRSVYPYPFSFTNQDKLSEIVSRGDDNALILHVISPANNAQTDKCIKMIIDPKNAQLFYYDMHDIGKSKPAGLLESDLKKMLK
ncbi:MAG: hypothetical protein KA793_07780 [Bacteroidales bacterium]|nr:hypothetical protein [Bacteroidales bacterium]